MENIVNNIGNRIAKLIIRRWKDGGKTVKNLSALELQPEPSPHVDHDSGWMR
jgi:hypothetical protein